MDVRQVTADTPLCDIHPLIGCMAECDPPVQIRELNEARFGVPRTARYRGLVCRVEVYEGLVYPIFELSQKEFGLSRPLQVVGEPVASDAPRH